MEGHDRPPPDGMAAVFAVLRGVAASRASVFITGGDGLSRRLAAEALHQASPRAGRRMVSVMCGASQPERLESSLFGHVKGALPGAETEREGAARQADGGTLFLDDIHQMPLQTQVKLVRLVQTGSFAPLGAARQERVDVRFVCATGADMALEVEAGRFREDLYYRLFVVPIELPAPDAAGAPPAPVAQPPGPRRRSGEEQEILPLAVMERRLIRAALRRTNGDVPRAAALLEINPSTVYRKLQTWREAGLPDES